MIRTLDLSFEFKYIPKTELLWTDKNIILTKNEFYPIIVNLSRS